MSLLNLNVAVPPHIAFLKLSSADEILDHDQNLLRFLGLDSSLLGQSFLQYIANTGADHVDFVASFPEAWKHLVLPTVVALNKHDGRLFYVEVQVQCDDDDNLLLWLHDVNAYHCTMDELREEVHYWKKKELQVSQLSEEKSDFLAVMSHELRTTLHGLLGMQHMIADTGSLSDEQKSCLSGAQISARSLKALIDDLFDISAIECGHSQLIHVPFKLYETLRDAMVPVSQLARSKDIRFRLELDQVPALVEGDVQRFRQVVMNLVNNAVRFTDSGHVIVRVSVQDKGLLVEVEDTGSGISDEYQNELRIGYETEKLRGGTRLGICIVSRFVSLMGGQIQLRSDVGQGTTVSMLMPLHFLEPNMTSLQQDMLSHYIVDPTSESAVKRYEGRKFQGIRVLLAEDDPIGQAVMYQRLKNEGFRYVDKAICGNTAWAMARTRHYHLIFLDVQMPGMDGIEVATRIREIEKKKQRDRSVIIALTAHATPDMQEHCRQAGMDDFVSKPSDADEIMRLVNHRLDLG